MKKFLLLYLTLTMMLLCGTLFAQGHLVISEILVTPTNGEFVEIYNPTAMTVDLSNYYITDATFAGGGTYYYKTVEGNGGGGNFWDFNARFPDGAQIAAGEYQSIAMAGDSLFFVQFGVLPTYEVFEDSTNFANDVPDMREATTGSIATFFNSSRPSGLTNGGEIVVLYHWDGTNDLVHDVDYVVWGDKDEAVDKTGVRIDSATDADTVSSEYNSDTPIANQIVVATGGHAGGMSWQRTDPNTEEGETTTGGNGIIGHDETSEDVATAFSEAAPTPGAQFPTSVENRDDAVPNTFALEQNYPNPFNPVTTIQYKVAKTDHVKIQIYNLVGQVVKTLVDQKQNQGDYTIVWHGDNNLGLPVSTGVYFLQMKATNFTKLLKMTLLR